MQSAPTNFFIPLTAEHALMMIAHAFHGSTIGLSGIVRVGAGLDPTSKGSLQSLFWV